MAKWSANEIEELKNLYKTNNLPSDQLIKDKTALESFAKILNSRLKRETPFTPEEIADRLLRIRKSGKLPRIRR